MFPIIKNISDVLPAIEGRKEFIVVEKPEGYTYIDYVHVEGDSFDDPIRLECRGLIFDTATGKILRRPLEKFFNYGEKGTYDTLDWSEDHYVMDKRDGSMIAPFILNGQVVSGTRAGVTDHAREADKLIDHLSRNEIKLCIQWGYTPIFEWTAPENRIVLPYEKSELRLLAMRHIISGEYVPVHDLENWAMIFGIKLVDFHDLKLDKNFILSYREVTKNVEGFVVYFPRSRFHIKIKTEDYSKMHRAVSFLDRENMILPVVLDNLYDDILPALSEDNQKRVLDYATDVHKALTEIVESLESDLLRVTKAYSDRKSCALWIQEHIKREYWPVMFHGLDGSDILVNTKKAVLKKPELLRVRWK